MTWSLMTVLSLLILLCFLIGWLIFRYAFCRRKKAGVDPALLGPLSEAQKKMIADGQAWISAHESQMTTHQILSDDGLRLRGKFLPAENARGTIILLHGYRSVFYKDFSCAFQMYHEFGYNILAVDQRAHGESEGKYICFGAKERYDCAAWARYVDKMHGGKLPIFLGGISMGATTVMLASALKLPKTVRGIIADCGFTSPWDIVRKVGRDMIKLDPSPFLCLGNFYCMWLANFDMKECSTLSALAKTKLPVLFIHGEKDNFVPVSMTKKSQKACASENEMLLVPEAGHGYSYLYAPERCAAALGAFLEKHRK